MSGRTLTKVTFEPGNERASRVTGEFDDGGSEVVYLDNVSVKSFLRDALTLGHAAAFFNGVRLWV